MPKIYTRTGDSGESSIKDERLRKDALVFDVLGTFDELNSWLGWLRMESGPDAQLDERARSMLESVQAALIDLSADLAGYGTFASGLLPALEGEIDRLTPNGPFRLCLPAGRIHIARTVCRRAERSLVSYRPDHPGLPFVNRLSDYLYVLAESSRKDLIR